jgi:hypothetical protein
MYGVAPDAHNEAPTFATMMSLLFKMFSENLWALIGGCARECLYSSGMCAAITSAICVCTVVLSYHMFSGVAVLSSFIDALDSIEIVHPVMSVIRDLAPAVNHRLHHP